MNVITINVSQSRCMDPPLLIGYAGEDSVDAVDFDFSAWAEDYGEGTISLELMRASDTAPYPAILTVDGTTARWTVSDVDTARSGPGVAQLIYKPALGTKKSAVYKFYVGRSLTEPGGDDPWGAIIERMEEILAEVQAQAAAADQSAEAASASAEDAEAWAVGERGGEPVPVTDETHENNAKYYAEQAGEKVREFTEDVVPAAVEDALREAKASGEFDGPAGETGPAGPVGPQGPKGDPGEVTQAEFDELSGDVGDLKSAFDSVLISKDAISNPIKITDGANGFSLKKFIVNLNPVEYSNIFVGITGINLFDKTKMINALIDGSAETSRIVGMNPISTYGHFVCIYTPIIPGQTYTIRQTVFSTKSYAKRYCLADDLPTGINQTPAYNLPQNYTPTESRGFQAITTSTPYTFVNKFNRKYLVCFVESATNQEYVENMFDPVLNSIMVVFSDSIGEYEPYRGNTYEINFSPAITGGFADLLSGFAEDGSENRQSIDVHDYVLGDNPSYIWSTGAANNVTYVCDTKQFIIENSGGATDNPLFGKKIIAIGDSMVYGHTLSANETWIAKIAERNNMTYTNYGVNGCTMAEVSGRNDSVYERYQSMTNDADFVCVFAGTNDCDQEITLGSVDSNDPSTFYGALNAIVAGLQAKYPTKTIIFITPYARAGIESRCKQYADAIETACGKGGIPVFNNIKQGGINWSVQAQLNALTLNDTYHLNAAGMIWASYKYERFLKLIAGT